MLLAEPGSDIWCPRWPTCGFTRCCFWPATESTRWRRWRSCAAAVRPGRAARLPHAHGGRRRARTRRTLSLEHITPLRGGRPPPPASPRSALPTMSTGSRWCATGSARTAGASRRRPTSRLRRGGRRRRRPLGCRCGWGWSSTGCPAAEAEIAALAAAYPWDYLLGSYHWLGAREIDHAANSVWDALPEPESVAGVCGRLLRGRAQRSVRLHGAPRPRQGVRVPARSRAARALRARWPMLRLPRAASASRSRRPAAGARWASCTRRRRCWPVLRRARRAGHAGLRRARPGRRRPAVPRGA